MKVQISKVTFDEQFQLRESLDSQTVDEYANLITDPEQWPFDDQVILFEVGDQLILVDGWHRIEAAKRAGMSTVSAYIRTGTIAEAFKYALSANASHGLKRNNADKRKAVRALLADELSVGLSNRQIAETCKVSEGLVRIVKKETSGQGRLAALEDKIQSELDGLVDVVCQISELMRSATEVPSKMRHFLDDVFGDCDAVLALGERMIREDASDSLNTRHEIIGMLGRE